jgi:hypothetical protein
VSGAARVVCGFQMFRWLFAANIPGSRARALAAVCPNGAERRTGVRAVGFPLDTVTLFWT